MQRWRAHPGHRGRAGDGHLPDDARLRLLRRCSAAGFAVFLVLHVAAAAGVGAAELLTTGGGNWLLLAMLVVVTAVRAALYREDRLAWACFAVGLACYLGGDAVLAFGYSLQLGADRLHWTDLGWLAFYPLAYVSLLFMLRSRVRRLSAGSWADGVVTGLTAGAFGAAFAVGAVLDHSTGSVGAVTTSLAYPIGDTLLLVLLAGSIAVMGRRAGASWWWLAAGMALFAGTDTLYVLQVASGVHLSGAVMDLGWSGTALNIGWSGTFLCFGLAALQRPRAGVSARPDGGAGLALPGLCALAALSLLFAGYLRNGEGIAGWLAYAAVLAALLRGALSFREVQTLAQSRLQARTDELTRLPNRRAIYEALAAADGTPHQPLAVLVLDLDRFKEINDGLGHAAGDALLQQVGGRLAGELRGGDLVGRLGGDEFVVLAADLDAAAATALAVRLRAQLELPFRVAGMLLGVGASIGVAVRPEQAGPADELLQLADLAMYSAKSARLGVAVYDDARDGAGRHRLETVEQLRAGIAAGELVLHHQPKLDLPTGTVRGVEALVRWAHPTRGLLPPEAFIDLAESAGLMPQLTGAVLEQALAACRTWHDAGRPLTVSVNVSPTDLVDPAFPAQVTGALLRHRLPASALVVEVTEGVLMADRVHSVAVLEELRRAGVGVSIDDYGTGYSSLGYLATLPVTELKLDRGLVADMAGSDRAVAVVASTLQLARSLGLEVVAEGVEDQATAALLTDLGCDLVQGFGISPPLPVDRLDRWLAARESAAQPA